MPYPVEPIAPDPGRLDWDKLGPWFMARMRDMGPRAFVLSQIEHPQRTSDPEAYLAHLRWWLECMDAAKGGAE